MVILIKKFKDNYNKKLYFILNIGVAKIVIFNFNKTLKYLHLVNYKTLLLCFLYSLQTITLLI
jgi:hypothetical protein